jgi:hypothetical protein
MPMILIIAYPGINCVILEIDHELSGFRPGDLAVLLIVLLK